MTGRLQNHHCTDETQLEGQHEIDVYFLSPGSLLLVSFVEPELS